MPDGTGGAGCRFFHFSGFQPEHPQCVTRYSTRLAMSEVGTTTFRMPYTPVTFGALIGAHRGDLFDVVRETPSHAWAAARGALFEDVGQWKRALAFPRPGEELHSAVRRECRAVRQTGGLFDASTLGKIEVVGRDAREFLNRMYVNDFARLLGAPVLLVGFGLPGENAHAPDEWISQDNFRRGMRAMAQLWEEMRREG